MGAQLTATHMQWEARGERGQHSGVGAAEGPGRRLAPGLLGCPLSTVTRLPQAATWSVQGLNMFPQCPSRAPWPAQESYPHRRGARAPSFQGARASRVPVWDGHLRALRALPPLSPLWASSQPTCGPHYS